MSYFIRGFSVRLTSFADKQDRTCSSATPFTVAPVPVLSGNTVRAGEVIRIARGKGNDKEIRLDYVPVSSQREAQEEISGLGPEEI